MAVVDLDLRNWDFVISAMRYAAERLEQLDADEARLRAIQYRAIIREIRAQSGTEPIASRRADYDPD